MQVSAQPASEPQNQRRGRPDFKVGQVWASDLEPFCELAGDRHWTIEAITAHPTAPVIARHKCGSIRCFGLDGHHDGEEEASNLDLTRLVREAR